jgi:hypothetical protein
MRLGTRAGILIGAAVVGAMAHAATFDHSVWDELLKKYVDSDGRVAYKRLQSADAPKLEAYLQSVAAADLSTLDVKEQMALYINAYNAYVFKGILGGSSAEGVFSRVGFFGFGKNRVGGVDYSLKKMEDDVLRGKFKDPRVHFALVCGSTSCPKLEREAYTGATLDALLDKKGREFLGDSFRNPLGAGPKDVKLSSIFKWFAGDFQAKAGSVGKFIARFAPASAPACLANDSCEFEYIDYDWSMNAQNGEKP